MKLWQSHQRMRYRAESKIIQYSNIKLLKIILLWGDKGSGAAFRSSLSTLTFFLKSISSSLKRNFKNLLLKFSCLIIMLVFCMLAQVYCSATSLRHSSWCFCRGGWFSLCLRLNHLIMHKLQYMLVAEQIRGTLAVTKTNRTAPGPLKSGIGPTSKTGWKWH